MSVSRGLKENISDIPKKVNDSLIEFIKIEKWEVSKTSLLGQKEILGVEIAERQTQIDEIDSLLLILGE